MNASAIAIARARQERRGLARHADAIVLALTVAALLLLLTYAAYYVDAVRQRSVGPALAAIAALFAIGLGTLAYRVRGQTKRNAGAGVATSHTAERDEASPAVLGARLACLTQVARIGLYEYDAANGSLWWSDTMYALVARTKGEFQPSLDAWYALIHPEDLARVLRHSDAATAQKHSWEARFRIMHPDGGLRQVHLNTSWTEAGGRGLWLGVAMDVTERVDAERRERVLDLQLRETFHQAGLAETANGVLQNVEQVLSGVGVAASVMRRELIELRPERVQQVAKLIADHRKDIAVFLSEDVRGKYLPDFLLAVGAQLGDNTQKLVGELTDLDRCVHHLRDIIGAQQSLIPMGGSIEPTDLRDLVEVALLVQAPDFARVETLRELDDLPLIMTDRHKLLKIIVCFVSNARDALLLAGPGPARITVKLYRDAEDAVFAIEDTGLGMTAETLAHLWEFGFTTKRNGSGVGLHASAIAAREIGATVAAHSDGVGQGARFSVRLPLGGPHKASRDAG
jgi:signal transduction histidine kinase